MVGQRRFSPVPEAEPEAQPTTRRGVWSWGRAVVRRPSAVRACYFFGARTGAQSVKPCLSIIDSKRSLTALGSLGWTF